MLVLPMLFALAMNACDADLQPVVLALQHHDIAQAAAILQSVSPACSQTGSYYELSGVIDELTGKPSNAEAALRKAIALVPDSAQFHQQLGAIYLRNRKTTEAVSELQQAVALDPENAEVKKLLIGAYAETGDWRRAAALFDQLGNIAFNRAEPIMMLWFAQAMIETGQTDRINLELSPHAASMPPALLFSLGTLFAQHRLYTQAVQYLQSIPADAADDAVYFNLALAYSHLHAFEQARTDYFLAIDRHPDHVEAYFHVGLDYSASGEGQRAVPWLFRAHELSPERVDIAYSLAEQLLALGYVDSAAQTVDAMVATLPGDPLLQVARADVEQHRGQIAAAVRGYRAVLAKRAQFVPALIGLARAEAAEGNDQGAKETLHEALLTNAEDPSIYAELGLLEAKQQDWNSALPHLTKAWTEDRSHPSVGLALARALRHSNRCQNALQVMEQLQTSMRLSPGFHLELAQLYSQLQRTTEAHAERIVAAQLQANAQNAIHFDEPTVYVH